MMKHGRIIQTLRSFLSHERTTFDFEFAVSPLCKYPDSA
jgi:hypothetical protein